MNFADSIKAEEYKEPKDVVADNGEPYEEWLERMRNTKKELSVDDVMEAVAKSIYEEIRDLGVIAGLLVMKITKEVVNRLFGEEKHED